MTIKNLIMGIIKGNQSYNGNQFCIVTDHFTRTLKNYHIMYWIIVITDQLNDIWYRHKYHSIRIRLLHCNYILVLIWWLKKRKKKNSVIILPILVLVTRMTWQEDSWIFLLCIAKTNFSWNDTDASHLMARVFRVAFKYSFS